MPGLSLFPKPRNPGAAAFAGAAAASVEPGRPTDGGRSPNRGAGSEVAGPGGEVSRDPGGVAGWSPFLFWAAGDLLGGTRMRSQVLTVRINIQLDKRFNMLEENARVRPEIRLDTKCHCNCFVIKRAIYCLYRLYTVVTHLTGPLCRSFFRDRTFPSQ